jgi:hypothetical protein
MSPGPNHQSIALDCQITPLIGSAAAKRNYFLLQRNQITIDGNQYVAKCRLSSTKSKSTVFSEVQQQFTRKDDGIETGLDFSGKGFYSSRIDAPYVNLNFSV